jgi:WD40 repeat protein
LLALCFSVLTAASVQGQSKSAPLSRGNIEMEDLGQVPKENRNLVFSEDGLHVAVVTPSRTKQRVYFDGQPGTEFDEIVRWNNGPAPIIKIARNGAHIAYIARRSGTNFLCLDDKETEVDLATDERLFNFSPDGAHFVHVRTGDDGLWHVVFDNDPDPGFIEITPPILFTADGGHYAYVAQSDKGQIVVLDGKAGPPRQNVGGLQFSPDGKHYAYQFTADDKFAVVLDGKTGPSYDGVQPDSLQFTADGQLAYAARKNTGDVAIVDGKEGGGCQQMEQLRVSPDGKRVAFVSTTSDGQTVVVNGKAGRAYDKITSLMFSPDGSRVAYAGELSTGKFAVVDEEESPAYRSISHLAFAAKGNRYGYVAGNEKGAVVVVDGHASRTYRTFVDLAISPDGSRYAYEGDVGIYEPELVIDGKAARSANIVATLEPTTDPNIQKVFCFSPNSKRLAMAAMVPGGAKYVIKVDGVECPTAGWCYRFIFSPDSSHFAYVTREPMRTEGWNTVNVTVDGKVVQSTHLTSAETRVLIAQEVEDSVYGRIHRVNPNYFQFRDDGKLKYLAVKDGRIARFSVTPGSTVAADAR